MPGRIAPCAGYRRFNSRAAGCSIPAYATIAAHCRIVDPQRPFWNTRWLISIAPFPRMSSGRRKAANVSMVAPSAPRDARSKIPPGPEGSNGIDRRGRRGQPAGPPPFWAFETTEALASWHCGAVATAHAIPGTGWHRGARQQRYRSTRAPRAAGGAATLLGFRNSRSAGLRALRGRGDGPCHPGNGMAPGGGIAPGSARAQCTACVGAGGTMASASGSSLVAQRSTTFHLPVSTTAIWLPPLMAT